MKRIYKIFLAASVLVFLTAGCNNTQPQNQIITQNSRQQIQVVQKVQGQFGDKLFNFYADENKTALNLLEISYKVETKNYPGIGDYVVSIAGTKADSKHFWEFFVNGKSSNVGAGSYKPQNGDNIEWKLSTIGSSKN